jgi:hypothetical protein
MDVNCPFLDEENFTILSHNIPAILDLFSPGPIREF